MPDINDIQTIRGLAQQVADIATLPVQKEKRKLWRRLNRLESERPMVMIDQLEEQGLLCKPQSLIHCTGAWTDELPEKGYDPEKPRTKDIWMFGLAQVFAMVSPDMFQEFVCVYLYHGCSNSQPIYGQKMERKSLTPRGQHQELIAADQRSNGWERPGENNTEMDSPWIEGAWMTRHNGRYYLQYSSPGTPLNVYSDAVYTADSPLGPFVCQAHNPVSFKPGGFMTGAGHGSTFQDVHGNWWHIATMRVSLRHKFERRLGLWPAGFDRDGVLFCNTRFGDWPMRMPNGAWDSWNDPFTGWMLLSYAKPVVASSERPEHPAGYTVDEDVRTFWAAATDDQYPWVVVDLGCEAEVRALQINFAELDCQPLEEQTKPGCHRYLVEGSNDGVNWRTVADRRDNQEDVPHDYLQLPEPCTCRHIRLSIKGMSADGAPAVSGLRAFGREPGDPPAAPAGLSVKRDQSGPCTAKLQWQNLPEAVGYNVRWGTAPDKLYSDWLVYDRNELTMHCLHADRDYWFTVEAFNESGVSGTKAPAVAKAL